ncbi:MAG: class I SAM-dependent methyltransferase [Stagnimonas sp.]|nr:class I SAM-dependent methyltransferase [Stagnimonas sp.]
MFELRVSEGRLSLRAPHLAGYGAISADWQSPDQRRRIQGGKKQLLAKAVGLHKQPRLHVLDGTAGLGRDSYTLAALGATVTLVERTPALVRLLRDAQARALLAEGSRAIAERLTVIEAVSHQLLLSAAAEGAQWDVIYLDPMYPEDGKSALPAKEMQVLRDLTGGDADADALLDPALACARQRVVVKRPAKAPWLAGRKPSLEYQGTQARFDVYLPQR